MKEQERYLVGIDWPAARFWREICAHYPAAKVLHSLRPEESWIASLHKTIHPAIRDRGRLPPGHFRDMLDMAEEIIAAQTFGGRLGDREHALAVYRAHTEEVRQEIPAERLLVYDVAEGWAPLCAFLGVAVPETPFPSTNTTAQFRERLASHRDGAGGPA